MIFQRRTKPPGNLSRSLESNFCLIEICIPNHLIISSAPLNNLSRTPLYATYLSGICLTRVKMFRSFVFIISDEIKLHAIQHFDPKQMRNCERIKLENILKSQRQTEFVFTKQMLGHEQWPLQDANQMHQSGVERYRYGETEDIEYSREICGRQDCKEVGLHEFDQAMQDNQSNKEEQLLTLRKQGQGRREETSTRRKTSESEEKGVTEQKMQKIHLNEEMSGGLKVAQQYHNVTGVVEGKREDLRSVESKQEREVQRSTSSDSDEDEVDPLAEAIQFNIGDKMRTIPPANIG